jgi:hypothetical protein
MARHNKLGNSFLGLALEPDEEKKLKLYLKAKKWSGKRYMRLLVRNDLNIIPNYEKSK